jgi:hypothetical protein
MMEYRICENGHDWLYKWGKQEFCPYCGSEELGYRQPKIVEPHVPKVVEEHCEERKEQEECQQQPLYASNCA